MGEMQSDALILFIFQKYTRKSINKFAQQSSIVLNPGLARKHYAALMVLEQLEQRGYVFGLNRVKRLLSLLGNPERDMEHVLVVGTNGKGSTSLYIYAALLGAGVKTGLYTSPHLLSYTERIQFAGRSIPQHEFDERVLELNKLCEKRNCRVTLFEFLTALTLQYFQEQGVELAVLEAGLGGRLDATNVVKQRVAVITNVDLDHAEFLGTTLMQRAREKVGVVKNKTVLVCGEVRRGLQRFFEEYCAIKRVNVRLFGKHYNFHAYPPTLRGQRFDFYSMYDKLDGLVLRMPGVHQAANASAAIMAVQELEKFGFNVTESALRASLSHARAPARLELVREKPYVFVDVAHNPAGVKHTLETLSAVFPGKKMVFVVGFSDDKPYGRMASMLARFASHVFCVEATTRALSAEMLAKEIVKHVDVRHTRLYIKSSVKEGVTHALEVAGAEDVVVVFGSHFVVAEALDALGIMAVEWKV
jgi:dihydrofolate synthase/folylpolyglutamate synthase